MLLFNFGYWEFWEAFNANNDTFGNQKVTFDGVNKLILINEGETEIDVKSDIYSNWKEWVRVRDNAKFEYAMTAIGGDPITATLFVGTTYFLENGWRVKPWEGNYVLTISGNMFTREPGQNPMIPTSGVSVALTRSNLVDLAVVETQVGSNGDIVISPVDITNIANGVWSHTTTSNTGANTYGTLVKDTNTNANDALKKGEFLALK